MIIKEKSACFGCLSTNQMLNKCLHKQPCGIDGCTEYHHSSLHGLEKSAFMFAIREDYIERNGKNDVILPIMKVHINYRFHKFISCLWDAGADISLITNEKARQLNLKGKPVKLFITTAGGGKSTIDSFAYRLELKDKHGNVHPVVVYGIDKITGNISKLEINSLFEKFTNVMTSDIERLQGDVDLLIGYNYAAWHPTPIQTNGHLLLLENLFGKCIGEKYYENFEDTFLSIVSAAIINVNHVQHGPIDQFMTIESLGVECSPKCGSCKCGSCPIGGKSYTLKEERELKLIEDNLEYKGDHWITGYPCVKDPHFLPDNYDYALKRLYSTERCLKRDPAWMKLYSDQIQDMVDRGVARKLSSDELKTYSGPIHYIAHHAVMKPDSKSTPIRIVFDSSHNYKGHCLNSYWAKGPDNFMNNILGMSLKFRENSCAIIGDIRKMYNSVYIRELDQHVHRFLWRKMNLDTKPDIYIITAVNMGDRPSGAIATVALRKTAILGCQLYPKAAEVVLGSSYVDDIVDSFGSKEEAESITNDNELSH